MRAAIVHAIGTAPTYGEFPEPSSPAEDEVIVDVTLAGLNPVDRLQVDGYQDPATPFVAGYEGVGRVGSRRVYFGSTVHPYGSFASRAVVKADALLDVPDTLSDELAIPLGIAGLSAWLPLTWETQLTGGERVLVTGATGMVGQIATQAAKLLGAGHVVAAGRHRETLARLLEIGADETVVLDGDPEHALAAAAGPGFDIVVDCVFGGPFRAALNCVAPRGTVIVVGLTAGTQVTLDFYELYARRVISYAAPVVPRAERQRAFDAMAAHVAAGRITFESERFGLDEIERALAELNKSAHRKLLIEP
jgi:NADPH:quinone reductase-like Zn-dependent oxidoreductase